MKLLIAWTSVVLSLLLFIAMLSLRSFFLRPYINQSEQEIFFDVNTTQQQFDPLYKKIKTLLGNISLTLIIDISSKHCVCNAISHRHVKQLERSANLINDNAYIKISQGEETVIRSQNKTLYSMDLSSYIPKNLPGTPSVLIYGASGHLRYFGTYGFGAFCTQSENALLEKSVTSTDFGTMTYLSVMGNGCFCDWSSPSQISHQSE